MMDTLDIRCLVPGEQTDGKVAVFKEIIQPGIGPPRHAHTIQTEVFHILSGTLAFELQGERSEYGAGDVIVVPPGVVHAFRNIGSDPAEIHFEMLPAGSSVEAFHRLINEDITDPDAFFQEYDMELLGPPLDS